MIDFKVDQKELADIVKRLGDLEKKARNKLIRKLTKEVLGDIRDEAESRAPYAGSGGRTIKGSFEITSRTRRGNVYAQLKNKAPHAHLQEMGWFWRKEAGGKIFHTIGRPYEEGPRPFMRPALDQKGDQAIFKLAEGLKEALDEVKK